MSPPPRAIGVLVPIDPGPHPPPPEQRPMGQAALDLEEAGVAVIFGDSMRAGRLTGLRPVVDGWRLAEDEPVAALFDRFPSQGRAARMAEILSELGDVPLLNGPAATTLCRDKLACQQQLGALGLPFPPVCADPAAFEQVLAGWGGAFLKPRFGALGVGVAAVRPGDPLPAWLPGVVAGQRDPALLQRAIPPPVGWAGWCLRALLQREAGGGWVLAEAVLRCSRQDPVVNAARGAEVMPARDRLTAAQLQELGHLSRAVGAAMDQVLGPDGAIELGIDLVVDEDGALHLIEVNGRPRGRLELLAKRDPGAFAAAHAAAIARPLRWLAWRYAGLALEPSPSPAR